MAHCDRFSRFLVGRISCPGVRSPQPSCSPEDGRFPFLSSCVKHLGHFFWEALLGTIVNSKLPPQMEKLAFGFSIQWILVICRYSVYEFAYSLKFICNPRLIFVAKQGDALPSCFCPLAINKCSLRGLYSAVFYTFFAFFVGDFAI